MTLHYQVSDFHHQFLNYSKVFKSTSCYHYIIRFYQSNDCNGNSAFNTKVLKSSSLLLFTKHCFIIKLCCNCHCIFTHEVALVRRQRRDLLVFESSYHQHTRHHGDFTLSLSMLTVKQKSSEYKYLCFVI